jgi:LAO/AO transport system kinase
LSSGLPHPRGHDPEELLTKARNGDRLALARLISVIERGGGPMRAVTRSAYRTAVPYTMGLTGAPGSGKSTLTSSVVGRARKGWPAEGHGHEGDIDEVAVLAIDPSSPLTGGAILGDRVRMQEHATDPAVYVRSMASRGHLGGLALAVPDTVRVLGAVGFPLVIVETVGVGQVEVEVAGAVDTTVVTVNPGWGDSVQANKAGLLEIADVFAINKADRPGARETRRDLEQMLDLSVSGPWRPPIVETVATTGEGVDDLWRAVGLHRHFLDDGGLLEERRGARLEATVRGVLAATLAERLDALFADPTSSDVRRDLLEGGLDPYDAADELLARLEDLNR